MSADPIGDVLWAEGEISTGSIDFCQPSILFRFDMWAECRITCRHGVYEHAAGGVDFTEAMRRAVADFRAHDHTPPCYNQCAVPEAWVREGSWKAGDTAECDLPRGHDGPCKAFATYEEEEAALPPIHVHNGRVVA